MRADYLSPKEVEMIGYALMPQNALIVKTMLKTGLRIGDVLSFRKDSLRTSMTITEKKTGKKRKVRLSQGLIDDILSQTVEGNPWAFPGRKPGTHKTRQAVWWDIKRAAKAFRLPYNASPHSLRKTYAVLLYNRCGDIAKVQHILNHDGLSVAMLYAMADRIRSAKRAA